MAQEIARTRQGQGQKAVNMEGAVEEEKREAVEEGDKEVEEQSHRESLIAETHNTKSTATRSSMETIGDQWKLLYQEAVQKKKGR